MEIRRDAAVAQGEKTMETNKNAPNIEKCAPNPIPAVLASTAPVPKINTGI